MNAGPHLAIGAACGLALAGGWSAEQAPTIGVCALAALLPDLDHHSSVASSWLRTGVTLVALAAGVLTAIHTDWLAQQPIGASILRLLASVSPALQLLLVGLVVGMLAFVVTSVVGEGLEPWRCHPNTQSRVRRRQATAAELLRVYWRTISPLVGIAWTACGEEHL
jgi:hypothetical protein